MSIVFIGGSRSIAQLPAELHGRIDCIARKTLAIAVGDADGIDKSVQTYLNVIRYRNVKVFSAAHPRNNIGQWPVRSLPPPEGVNAGFERHAAKDRTMADIADFGLMIWDGRSPGTILNVLRLVRAHKITVLFNAAEQSTTNVKGANDWRELVKRFPVDVFRAVRQRATDQEWLGDCGSATTIRASTGDSFPASHQRSA